MAVCWDVHRYCRSSKNIRLKYPHLPCALVGSSRDPTKRNAFPVELCQVAPGGRGFGLLCVTCEQCNVAFHVRASVTDAVTLLKGCEKWLVKVSMVGLLITVW